MHVYRESQQGYERLFLTLFLLISFRKKGFNVRSFGTGNQVKLPGPSPTSPNIYDFSTTYDEMYKDLLRKDFDLYPFSSKILCIVEGKSCTIYSSIYRTDILQAL